MGWLCNSDEPSIQQFHTSTFIILIARSSPQHSPIPHPDNMSRQYSQYSQPAYQPASPGGYQDDHPTSPPHQQHYQQQPQYHSDQPNRSSRYDPDPQEYDNPFYSSERRYEEDSNANRGYTDDQFNVASDFNNQGPRYGELYGGQSRQEMAQLAAGARPMMS
jgi:hypothetical protein